jgi:hypothetical protein
MLRYSLLIFMGWFSFAVFAQETPAYWQLNMGYGSAIKHRESMGHLVTEHPYLFQLSWAKTSDTTTVWKKRLNYPDVGVTLSHERFRNEFLGNVTGLSYFTNFYLLNRNHHNQLTTELGFGISYADSPMDLETNNQNNAITSSILFNQYLKFNYKYPQIYKGVGIQTGLTFIHFSNASFKSPNNGINSIFLNVGLNFNPTTQTILYPEKKNYKDVQTKKPFSLHMKLGLGLHEVYPGLGTKPVYTFSTMLSKPITNYAHLQTGVDFFASMAAKKYATFQYIAGYNQVDEVKDYKQIGAFVGYEYYFEKLSMESQVGYYLYDPLHLNLDLYGRLGLKYHFVNQPFSIGMALKIHNFKADYTTLDFQYTLF